MLTVIVILVLVSAAAYFIYTKYLADKQETDLVKEALASLKIEPEDFPPYVEEDGIKESELDALAKAQQAKAEADTRAAIAEKVVEKAKETLAAPVVEKVEELEPVAVKLVELEPEVEKVTEVEPVTKETQAKPAPKRYYRRKNKPKK